MYFFLLVFQWNLICDKANIAATVQSLFVAGMMAGSLSFGAISDFFGRRFCLFLCSALAVSIRDQRINRQSKLLSLLSWFNFAFLCSVRLQSSIVGLNFVTRPNTVSMKPIFNQTNMTWLKPVFCASHPLPQETRTTFHSCKSEKCLID